MKALRPPIKDNSVSNYPPTQTSKPSGPQWSNQGPSNRVTPSLTYLL